MTKRLGTWTRPQARLLVAAALSIAASQQQSIPEAPVARPAGKPELLRRLDPTLVPKYVIPLVIPPIMKDDGTPDSYDIAVREFKQQILPGGIWNTINGRDDGFRPTTVWSYGPAADDTPRVAPDPGSQFNYPAYTLETLAHVPVQVRWINDLVDEDGKFLPHLLPIDQTLHWANPGAGPGKTDSVGTDPESYEGPVPIVTHVHGAHVAPASDGYPEAWWLPAARDIPQGYATKGRLFDDATGTNPGDRGYADYAYTNDQPAATLWYHDHTLGMTRANVYAGPAGFWLVRGGPHDGGTVGPGGAAAVLPGPAAQRGQGVLELNVPGSPARNGIRELAVAIQDRSFLENGQLFYPRTRAFFEGLLPRQLKIEFAPETDVAPIWQPEAFFDVMVVNGVAWPSLDVAQALYRFRLLNGCNSRFLNLALEIVDSPDPALVGTEIPFFQIGAEQGFLPRVAMISTGFATELPGTGVLPPPAPAPDPDQALVLGNAERADVLVDFRGLPTGTVVRMTNTGPDEPFGGFTGAPTPGDEPVADPETTGQVLQIVVDASLNGASPTDPTGATPATAPEDLVPNAEGPLPPAHNAGNPRNVSLNEEESEDVCVLFDPSEDAYVLPVRQVPCDTPSPTPEGYEVVPFGPVAALLGLVDLTGPTPAGEDLHWTEPGTGLQKTIPLPSGSADVWITENPALDAVEEWDIYNFTVDAHPIHLHLVRFEVVERTVLDPETSPPGLDVVQPWESGFKDTVIAYPGQITRVKARFDLRGLYVWHCHIVEHEDNEMMRPYFVGD